MRISPLMMQPGVMSEKGMNNKAWELTSYVFSKDETILIDTNIWLYLYPPPCNPRYEWATKYSRAIRNLKEAEAIAVLDPIVMSEYLNAYSRIVWKGEFKEQYPNFKKFRQSKDFHALTPTLLTHAKGIIDFSTVHSVASNHLDLDQTLNNFVSGNIDFNDSLFVDICRQRSFKLMTHDGDFNQGGIELITANKKLLRIC